MGGPAPSGVKLVHNTTNAAGVPVMTEKSYSPISLPDATGYFELLVKKYPPAALGGFGSFLVGLEVGQTAAFKVKPARIMHGSPGVGPNRWAQLGFVAGGTGVAPFIQIIRTLLADPRDHTKMWLLRSLQSGLLLRTSRPTPGKTMSLACSLAARTFRTWTLTM